MADPGGKKQDEDEKEEKKPKGKHVVLKVTDGVFGHGSKKNNGGN